MTKTLWTPAEEARLLELRNSGVSRRDLADRFGRSLKDTQELHHEKVGFIPHIAQGLSDKAVEIIRAAEANDLPPRIAASPDFHICRFCPFHDTCWEVNS